MKKWQEFAQFLAAIVIVFAAFVGGIWTLTTRLEDDLWERIERRGMAIMNEVRQMITKHEREHHGKD